jgi:prolyl oligopeptidase
MVRIGRGTDATESVEYDLDEEDAIVGGLFVPRSVHELSWDGPEAILVTRRSALPDGSHRWVVDRLVRGRAEAERVHTYPADRVAASLTRDPTAPGPRYVSTEWLDHRRRSYRLRVGDGTAGEWHDLPLPPDVRVVLHGEWAVLIPLGTWTHGVSTFRRGDVLVTEVADLLNDVRRVRRVWTSVPGVQLARVVLTRNYIVATLRGPVRTSVISVRLADGVVRELCAEDSSFALRPVAVDPLADRSADDVWVTSSGATRPPSLHRFRVADGAPPLLVQPRRAAFRHDHYDTRTVEAIVDGLRVKYTIVAPRREDHASDTSVVVSGYGGFSVPETVDYLDITGPSWLDPLSSEELPAAFVFAHVAHGSKSGAQPWERLEGAAERFLAVVDHLVAEGVSRPGLIGASGASHGSLLVMNAVLTRPELFGAVVCRSGVFDLVDFPVLDGTAWLDEYGDPRDERQRRKIALVSPMHRVPAAGSLPPALFWCAADDDRVAPTHSRRMTKRLRELGGSALYLESPVGGHDGLGTTAAGTQGHAITGTFFRRHLR